MAASTRVLNLSSNRTIKRSQAIGRVEQCVSEWVEFGYKIRDLSLAERIAKRQEQATKCEGLFYYVEGKEGKPVTKPYFAELPNCVFRRPGHEGELYAERMTAIEANQFARCAS